MSMTDRRTSTISDVQARSPSVALSLSRVGVTGVEKVIRLRHDAAEQLFSARFERIVELGNDQKGAHMSRFEEVVNDAMVRRVIDGLPQLHDRAFVSACQVNLETIHQHNVVAERCGALEEIRAELATGIAPRTHTGRQAWLAGTP